MARVAGTGSLTATAPPPRRAYVLHPYVKGRQVDRLRSPEARLEEAVGLAAALGLEICGAQLVPLPATKAATLLGEGKVAELKTCFAQDQIGLVIVDGTVSPIQQRNLEREWNVKVLDRTGLILEIFGARARTAEGALQVELAHLTYQRSRLVRAWTHLERQRGGFGFMGGPGETQKEADRRQLDERITLLRARLDRVERTRSLHRKARQRAPYPVVSLVGYTNAGKSTLFNTISGAEVLAKDMLFATLDPTMRALRTLTGRQIVLSDTVGFISDLPTQLVAAFRATLEEVLEADLLIHVRDMSHPEAEAQGRDVMQVLASLAEGQALHTPIIEAWNKIDLLPADQRAVLAEIAARRDDVVLMSAITGEGLPALSRLIDAKLGGDERVLTLRLRHGAGAAQAWLHQRGGTLNTVHHERGTDITLRMSAQDRGQFLKLHRASLRDLHPELLADAPSERSDRFDPVTNS